MSIVEHISVLNLELFLNAGLMKLRLQPVHFGLSKRVSESPYCPQLATWYCASAESQLFFLSYWGIFEMGVPGKWPVTLILTPFVQPFLQSGELF